MRVASDFNDSEKKTDNPKKNSTKMNLRKFVICIAIAICAFIFINSSFTIVPTGYTGVRTTFGQINETPVPNGINFKLPFIQTIELVNNKQQDMTDNSRVWSETSERTAIYYEGITVTYQIDASASAWIYAHVADYKNALVSSQLIASAIKASSKTLSDVDATNRGLIEPLVQENLQKSINSKYKEGIITINKITISNVDFDDSYNLAIANRQKAQIEAEQQAIENEKNIKKAEADAKVKLTEAQAAADALLIQSKAEAEANEILQKSLTSEILKQMYIEKWNGILPKVMSNDSNILIGLDEIQSDISTQPDVQTQSQTQYID